MQTRRYSLDYFMMGLKQFHEGHLGPWSKQEEEQQKTIKIWNLLSEVICKHLKK